MNSIRSAMVLSTILLTTFVASPARPDDVVSRDSLTRSLRFGEGSGPHRIVVDNINGPISVVGYGGSTVELIARRRIRAESSSRIEEAKREIILDVTEEADRVLIYVDAPWRRSDGSVNYRGWDHYGYDVDYEFELRVPSGTDFALKTVNNGDIDVRGMTGAFEVHNVNGDIAMSGISGSGRASTVNGDVVVGFARNPSGASSFGTVNGKVDVEFPEPVSANLRLKTMNGEVYTDFPVKSLPASVSSTRKKNGKKIYRSGDSFVVEAGGGGPELSFNTLNGNIYLSLKGDHQ